MNYLTILLTSLILSITINASETTPTQEEVAKLYVATFNRAPDSAGLNYWVNDSGLQLSQIGQSFFDQEETQILYPPSALNREFIGSIYQNLFNRTPDTEGWNYWEDELNKGNLTKDRFIEAVINGAQNTDDSNDADILSNKTTVGISFSEAGLSNIDDARTIMIGVSDSLTSMGSAVDRYGISLSQDYGDNTDRLERIKTNNEELYSYILGSDIIDTRLPDNTNIHDMLASRLAYYMYTKIYEPELDLKVDLYYDEMQGIEATQEKINNFSKAYLNIGGLVTELSIYLADSIGTENFKKKTKVRVANAITSSGKSEFYGFAFAGHDSMLEVVNIVDNCLNISIPWYTSISSLATEAADKAGEVFNCAIGETVTTTGRFVNSYNGFVTVQEYEYQKIAKIYLDAYFSCGYFNETCMASKFNGKLTQDEQVQYIMEEFLLDTGIDWSVRQGAYIVIDDYIQLVTNLTNDITSLIPSNIEKDDNQDINYQNNLVSGKISFYGGHTGAKYIRITPIEETTKGYSGIMCKVNSDDTFGDQCVLHDGISETQFINNKDYDISIYTSISDEISWKGSAELFIAGDKHSISDIKDIDVKFGGSEAEVVHKDNFLSGNLTSYGTQKRATHIRITPPEGITNNNYAGIMCELDLNNDFGSNCVLQAGANIDSFYTGRNYDISIYINKSEDWYGSASSFLVGDSQKVANLQNISVNFNNWNESPWNSCSGSCGTNNATETREVSCKSFTGEILSDSYCEGSKPITSQACTASQCIIDPN